MAEPVTTTAVAGGTVACIALVTLFAGLSVRLLDSPALKNNQAEATFAYTQEIADKRAGYQAQKER